MFEHSVKVPRLYKTAALMLKNVIETGASVKSVVYKKKHPNIKALYALIIGAIQRKSQLEFLFKKSDLFKKEPRLDPWLAKILVTELLWGKKQLASECKPVKTILAYHQVLKAHSDEVIEDTELVKVKKPRYVRVNTLKMTLNEAIDAFRDQGWTFKRFTDKNNYGEFLNVISNLEENEFTTDIHISDLLVFNSSASFYRHDAYLEGKILLQDKASCLPVQLLKPTPGSSILDMCAAPGMKTTQLAAAIKNEGKVYAVEMDKQRMVTLQKLVDQAGATCVQTLNKDVLTVTPKDISNVEYILVDPSCSGSGITDRIDTKSDAADLPARLKKLAGFQIKILKHALRSFPQVKRVVYSTCSLYPEENEEVVRDVISHNKCFKLVSAHKILEGTWYNFGSDAYGDIGKMCLYARPDDDLTNGFFVAVFERLEEGEKNEFFVSEEKINNSNTEPTKVKKRTERVAKRKTVDNRPLRREPTSRFDLRLLLLKKMKEKYNNKIQNVYVGAAEKKLKRRKNIPVKKGKHSKDEPKKKKKEKSKNDTSVITADAGGELVIEKKKTKKHKDIEDNINEESNDVTKSKKKKKEKESKNETSVVTADEGGELVKEKKKSKKHQDIEDNIIEESNDVPKSEKKKKEKKSKNETSVITADEGGELVNEKKKTKKHKHIEDNITEESNDVPKSKKKKKEKEAMFLNEIKSTFETSEVITTDEVAEPVIKKKKKKKTVEC